MACLALFFDSELFVAKLVAWWLVSGRFVGALLVLGVALLVLMMPLIGGRLGDWRWDELLEDGWGVVVLMVGKYISMVVCDCRRRDLLVRAG